MTDKELIEFGKNVRKLAENPFQRQLDEARRERKQRKEAASSNRVNIAVFQISCPKVLLKLAA
jgi:hypothetical protein